MDQRELKRRNARSALIALSVAVGMVGAAFAFVPFYDAFCRALGIGGATQVATAAPTKTADVPVTVRFDSNVDRALPWEFYPTQDSVSVIPGETRTIHYIAKNTSDRPTTGTATFNVTPEKAGTYFSKIVCFCFQEQTLQPGETMDMAVSFFVDPEIVENHTTDDVRTITLSYTFFRSLEDMMKESAADTGGSTKISYAAPAQ
ncbi:MAG: cytochrome c oxidase assembly protein [Rhodospirillaceae bacterium]